MAGVDAGALVACGGCGNTVLQKAMVPVLVAAAADDAVDSPAADDAVDSPAPVGYLCIPCARLQIVIPTEQPASGG